MYYEKVLLFNTVSSEGHFLGRKGILVDGIREAQWKINYNSLGKARLSHLMAVKKSTPFAIKCGTR